MAQDYRLVLVDEFDWQGYRGGREAVISLLATERILLETEPVYGLMVFTCRFNPMFVMERLKETAAPIGDSAYYQEVPSGALKEIWS